MKKLFILLIICLCPVVGFSSIDECKTDVYFGNGILTDKQAAKENTKVLKVAIKDKPSLNNHIGKVDYAYNITNALKNLDNFL